MAKFMRFLYMLYGLIFVVLIAVAIYSFFGGFSHEFMDPVV